MAPDHNDGCVDVTGASGNRCRLMIGTSGYSYAEWVDAGFYPAGTQAKDMLACYTKSFSTVELNFTWYQMPKASRMEQMLQRVPPEFRFAAKLNRGLTHERDLDSDNWRGKVGQYRDGIAPLVQARKLKAILIQLPPYFDRSRGNRLYLAHLLDALGDLPLAVEFRNRSWATDRVFRELENRGVTLVSVDEPDLPGLFPPLDVVTSDLIYIRFHGRNTKGWHSGNMQLQFDYDYTDAELDGWAEKIVKMAKKASSGVLFFNNHVRAQAPGNAKRLTRRLIETIGR